MEQISGIERRRPTKVNPKKWAQRFGSPQYELILGLSADLWDYDGPKMPEVLKLLSGLPLATVKPMEIIGKISS